MAARTREDRRLRLLSATCLAMPEAERTNCGAHADFRVRGKIFAYFLKNHSGDGIVAACFKARLGGHVEHVKRAPERFFLPRFLGRRGWVGLRLDRGDIDWDEISVLAQVSYSLAAPKGLRPTSSPTANALTNRSLVKGPPPAAAEAVKNPPSPAQRVDGNLFDAAQLTDQRMGQDATLHPAPAPNDTHKRSGGLRGRR